MKSTSKGNGNRLLTSDAEAQQIAASLYALVADLPIISPHGHVDPSLLVNNAPFANPAELFIAQDHYVKRLLHASGISLEAIGHGERTDESARRAWQLLCENWNLLAGTASGYWLTQEFAELFGIEETPDAENAQDLYDRIASELLEPHMLPRALFERFGISVLATTDDPCDDLSDHASLAADPTFSGRVLPTFRPDKYIDPRAAGWSESVQRLIDKAGLGEVSYANFILAIETRRAYFIEHGAVSADHGVEEPYTCELSRRAAESTFERCLSGVATAEEQRDFAGHMLVEMARMSSQDGLVMTLHAGVLRNHSSSTFEKFGADTGHDIPVAVEFTRNLRPLLDRYGLEPNLTLILFCLDESAWSREIAPLAGFYPSVRIGAPWWFLDAPDSAMRFREAVTETAGFYRGSGFIDDTRAFLSIPARHDMARRVDSAYLARLVAAGRITFDQAKKIAVDLVTTIPESAFKL